MACARQKMRKGGSAVPASDVERRNARVTCRAQPGGMSHTDVKHLAAWCHRRGLAAGFAAQTHPELTLPNMAWSTDDISKKCVFLSKETTLRQMSREDYDSPCIC